MMNLYSINVSRVKLNQYFEILPLGSLRALELRQIRVIQRSCPGKRWTLRSWCILQGTHEILF